MSHGAQVEYDALAQQYGAASSTPGAVDYDALAQQHGALSSTPAANVPNDYLTKTEDAIHGFIGGALKNIPFLGKYFNNYSQAGVVNPNVEKMGEGAGRVYEQGLEMAATGGPLKAGAETLATKLPFLGRFAEPLLRTAAEALNTGANAAIHGQPVGTSAALGAGGAALGEAGQALAPNLAESALRITDRMRGRGRDIGNAVLDATSGIRPGTIATQAGEQLGDLTGQMEDAVHQATLQGAMGSTQPAHDALDQAIANTPRNAVSLRNKLAGLRDTLNLDPANPQMNYSPDELLEIKRGIGKEIKTWGPDWQKIDDVKNVQQRLYGAIDGQLDKLVPGNDDINQMISSLIPAKRQATRLSQGASITQSVANRLARPTGALAAAGFGGVAGYREGGTPGAVLGSTAGLLVPDAVSSPTGQMAAARLMQSNIPAFLSRLIVASQQQNQNGK